MEPDKGVLDAPKLPKGVGQRAKNCIMAYAVTEDIVVFRIEKRAVLGGMEVTP